MDKEESTTDLGTVRIHKNVIASIASQAAMEVEGVKSINVNFKSGLMELLSRNPLHTIGVEFDKSGEVKLEIPLVIKYGYNIPSVAGSVQESVRNALEKMTNLSIKDININVQGIERG